MVLSALPKSMVGENVLYVGSSISYHCDFDILRNETGAEVITRKAYGTVFSCPSSSIPTLVIHSITSSIPHYIST